MFAQGGGDASWNLPKMLTFLPLENLDYGNYFARSYTALIFLRPSPIDEALKISIDWLAQEPSLVDLRPQLVS
jgi:hypothetical protein